MLILTVLLTLSRIYWPVQAAEFAVNGSAHTHVEITGFVSYVHSEADGDLHLGIVPSQGATSPLFVAECIPSLPCNAPPTGSHVNVKGISRRDLEHGWNEI